MADRPRERWNLVLALAPGGVVPCFLGLRESFPQVIHKDFGRLRERSEAPGHGGRIIMRLRAACIGSNLSATVNNS